MCIKSIHKRLQIYTPGTWAVRRSPLALVGLGGRPDFSIFLCRRRSSLSASRKFNASLSKIWIQTFSYFTFFWSFFRSFFTFISFRLSIWFSIFFIITFRLLIFWSISVSSVRLPIFRAIRPCFTWFTMSGWPFALRTWFFIRFMVFLFFTIIFSFRLGFWFSTFFWI